MKAKHHFWSSVAAGSALYWATGSGTALIGTMVGGFLIDLDHLLDQAWSIKHGARYRKATAQRLSGKEAMPNWFVDFLRPRQLLRLPLVFHSYELLAIMGVIAFEVRTPFWFGILLGYALHISLDLFRHHREFSSPLFYFVSFRLLRGFRRDRLIKPEYL